jgi:hypothetical protein
MDSWTDSNFVFQNNRCFVKSINNYEKSNAENIQAAKYNGKKYKLAKSKIQSQVFTTGTLSIKSSSQHRRNKLFSSETKKLNIK